MPLAELQSARQCGIRGPSNGDEPTRLARITRRHNLRERTMRVVVSTSLFQSQPPTQHQSKSGVSSMTKYVLRINKPLKDLDDDEMLLLLIVPARMKGETYTLLSRNSDGFGKIVPYHTHDLMNWCYLAGRAFETSIALYQLFKAEEFWDRDQEGPNDDEIMRAVLAYALRPN